MNYAVKLSSAINDSTAAVKLIVITWRALSNYQQLQQALLAEYPSAEEAGAGEDVLTLPATMLLNFEGNLHNSPIDSKRKLQIQHFYSLDSH